MSDDDLVILGVEELNKIGLVNQTEIKQSHVRRVEKAYPGYFGIYDQFHRIQEYTDSIANCFLIGRNGMHRYNNQDHSMLTAKEAVQCVIKNISSKKTIWDVNIDDEYHEEKSS